MGEFVKPKRVIVSDKEYIQKLVNANLVKDLHDNEEICPYCHGTGMDYLMIQTEKYGFHINIKRLLFVNIVLMV